MNSLIKSSLSLLAISLLLHNGLTAADDPLFNICTGTNNYTDGSLFDDNLNQLMFYLATGAPPTGFALGSVGQGTDRANGLALCRGDVTSSACSTCIQTAKARILSSCPSNKQAIIWFNNCLLRYSDVEFFGEIDNTDKFYLLNTQNASSSLVEFEGKVKELMNRLQIEAYLTPLFFASGEMEVEGSQMKLYGLVQCTRDLSGGDCKACLESAITELPSCCYGKQGGRVVGGSCNIRYEMYPFFDA